MLVTAGLTGCGGKDSDEAKSKVASHGQARWMSFPVEIYVDNRIAGNPAIEADVLAALNFWETKASRQLFLYKGAAVSPAAGIGGAVNPLTAPANQAFFQNPWPYSSNMLALNMRIEQGGAIQRSIITINDNFSFCHGDCVRDPAPAFRKVLAHEIGHFLGFDHHPDVNNVMFTFYQPGVALSTLGVDWSALSTLIR